MTEAKLKRSISLPAILFYGLGTMVGGEVLAHTGKIAAMARYATTFVFLIAGILAIINAFTLGELSYLVSGKPRRGTLCASSLRKQMDACPGRMVGKI